MEKREQLYEGKAKKVYATDDPNLCIVSYKDDATAFNGEKRGTILGKGVINNRLTNRFMRLLEQHGIPTHYVEELSERETLVKKVQIVRSRSSCATFPRAVLPSATASRKALCLQTPPWSIPIRTTNWATRS